MNQTPHSGPAMAPPSDFSPSPAMETPPEHQNALQGPVYAEYANGFWTGAIVGAATGLVFTLFAVWAYVAVFP